MANKHETPPQHQHELRNADYVVWRVMRGRRHEHDERIARAYNLRARNTHTRH